MKREQREFDPVVRSMLKAGAAAGSLALVFGPGALFTGCSSSSRSKGGVFPTGGGGGGGTTMSLKAHLESKYDLDYDPIHTDLVVTVRDKSTGGVLASGNVYICLKDSAGTITPIGNSVNNVMVKTGDKVLIGDAVVDDPGNPDELERYRFVTGPYETTV